MQCLFSFFAHCIARMQNTQGNIHAVEISNSLMPWPFVYFKFIFAFRWLFGNNQMMGNSFGALFRISSWGESHGGGGLAWSWTDALPISLGESDIQPFLDRRRPDKVRSPRPVMKKTPLRFCREFSKEEPLALPLPCSCVTKTPGPRHMMR